MSNLKVENVKKAKDILTTGEYGRFHKANFENYNYGDITPVNNDILNVIPKGTIILSDDVYQTLLAVQDLTADSGKEVPFFLYGREAGDNQIIFEEFYSKSSNRTSTEASFGEDMINNLTDKLKNNKSSNLAVCRGHSHPPVGPFCENFSIGDLAGDIQFNQDNEIFRTKKVEAISCVVAPSGDINFLYYDNVTNNFYRFTNVVVKSKDNKYTNVDCYGSGKVATEQRQR